MREAASRLSDSVFPIDTETGQKKKTEEQDGVVEFLETGQKTYERVVVLLESEEHLDSWNIRQDDLYLAKHVSELVDAVRTEVKIATAAAGSQKIGGKTDAQSAEDAVLADLQRRTRLRRRARAEAAKLQVRGAADAVYESHVRESSEVRDSTFTKGECVETQVVQRVEEYLEEKGDDDEVAWSARRFLLGGLTVALTGGALYVAGKTLSFDKFKEIFMGGSEATQELAKDLEGRFYNEAARVLGDDVAERLRQSNVLGDVARVDQEQEMARNLFASAVNSLHGEDPSKLDHIYKSVDAATKRALIAQRGATQEYVLASGTSVFGSGGFALPIGRKNIIITRYSLEGSNQAASLALLEASKKFVSQLDPSGGLSTSNAFSKFIERVEQVQEQIRSLPTTENVRDLFSRLWTIYDADSMADRRDLQRVLTLFTRSVYAAIPGYFDRNLLTNAELYAAMREYALEPIPQILPIDEVLGSTRVPIEQILEKLEESVAASISVSSIEEQFTAYHPIPKALLSWCARQNFLGRDLGVRSAQFLIGGTLSTLNIFSTHIYRMIAPLYDWFAELGVSRSIFGYLSSIVFNYGLSWLLGNTGNVVATLGLRGVGALSALLITTGEILSQTLLKLFGFVTRSDTRGAQQWTRSAFGGLVDSVNTFTKFTLGGLSALHFLSQVTELVTLITSVYGSILSSAVASAWETTSGSAIISVFAAVAIFLTATRGVSTVRYMGHLLTERPLAHLGAVMAMGWVTSSVAAHHGVEGLNLWSTITGRLDNLLANALPLPEGVTTADEVSEAFNSTWNADTLREQVQFYMTNELGVLSAPVPRGTGLLVDVESMSEEFRKLL